MVHTERFELPTSWFVAKCSNPLNYGCAFGVPGKNRTFNLWFFRPALSPNMSYQDIIEMKTTAPKLVSDFVDLFFIIAEIIKVAIV